MKLIPLAAAALLAFGLAACTPEQRCAFYQWSHAKAIERANGDAEKIRVANVVYAPLKEACRAQGVIIN